ncbi:MAG: FHA domain-containing protein [Anaerolineales bacterium]|nr:FHA domain-containing protein [Anaerolineales bacterium]
MGGHNGEVPVLISQTGKLTGTRWALDRDEIIIGRSPNCDFVIPDRQVSREHARLYRSEDGFYIHDMDSKNGTYLNGSTISKPTLLQDGDVIQVALAVKLMYLGTEATIPLAVTDAAKLGLGRLRMDSQAHRVWVRDVEVEPALSLPQFRLLYLLYSNPDKVVSREAVVDHVWPDSEAEGVSEQAIDALVRRLRERLAEVDKSHSYVVTVRGHGFRLDNPI